MNEDIFDRMPSRRFKRTDRRAEHHDDPGPRFERRTSGPAAEPRAGEWVDDEPRRDDWADAHERRQVAPRRSDWADSAEPAPRRAAEWDEVEPRRDDRAYAADRGSDAPRRDDRAHAADRGSDAPRRDERAHAADRSAEAPRRAERGYAAERGADAPAPPRAQTTERRPARRPAESWTAGDEGSVEVEGKRPIQSWLEPERGESRTIVLERAESEVVDAIEEPPGRRTVTITGHPDRLPAPRAQRPPRTAIERIGASPDRIAGYAVLLGFVLILIAVLTTGQ